jgi:hypothetical protein
MAELDHELRQTQLQVARLESDLENARLARILGDDAGDPETIAPELDRFRGSLERQQALIDQVKASRRDARAAYMIQRLRARTEARERDAAGSD